ncbi:MAG: CvpA family protein [Candidatus Lambdaproteobacteria bacterium]|nr:CvpA family protein [Candidatus Lambdaproteobacteria bacterium]
MNVNVLDIVFVGLMVVFALLSFSRGAVRELLALLGLAAGFLAAQAFYLRLARVLGPLVPDRRLAELLGFLAILVLGYFAGVFLSQLGEMVRERPANLFNRMVGGALGFAKGVLFSMVLHWAIASYVPPFQDELRGSAVGRVLGRLIDLASRLSLG